LAGMQCSSGVFSCSLYTVYSPITGSYVQVLPVAVSCSCKIMAVHLLVNGIQRMRGAVGIIDGLLHNGAVLPLPSAPEGRGADGVDAMA
jgi:hypothetical protein